MAHEASKLIKDALAKVAEAGTTLTTTIGSKVGLAQSPELQKANQSVQEAQVALKEATGANTAPALARAQSKVAEAEVALQTAASGAVTDESKAELAKIQGSVTDAKTIIERAIALANDTVLLD